jgi:hypothetical protein
VGEENKERTESTHESWKEFVFKAVVPAYAVPVDQLEPHENPSQFFALRHVFFNFPSCYCIIVICSCRNLIIMT